MTNAQHGGAFLLVALLSLPCHLYAAASPFDIDVKELDRTAPKAAAPAAQPKAASPYDIDLKELDRSGTPPAKQEKKAKKKEAPVRSAKPSRGRHAVSGEGEYGRYTVKPGDHIFKILVVRFGLSDEAAEKLIPEIIRINDVPDIKKLRVGSTLLIPTGAHQARSPRTYRHSEPVATSAGAPAPLPAPATQPSPPAVAAPPASAAPAAPRELPPPPAPVAKAPAPAPPLPLPQPAVSQPAPAAQPAPPLANTWICSVRDRDPARIVDSVLNALALRWSKNRIIQSAEGAANAYSIRVDRYFEKNGARYIVSIGEEDPYSYTLLRLLEGSGFRVLMIGKGDDFLTIGEKLLRLVGLTPDFGKHLVQAGKLETGFLVQQDDPEGRRVLLTSEPADPKVKWTLPAGCGYR
ncbi:hypothetical protein GMST_13000 [Geomonas silvestris]|uniref:LysM domain-containing protein n=1 Tax=Geomonas silvestris TaxID=2740184 RepID=A0A6V8MG75_9BACT|nr:LysM peptidoglycan-binding domain-containing protein [Geomonas silvestris]GFO58975.1 hypothetical protein GMST_13000 [Geomonas silvestris]